MIRDRLLTGFAALCALVLLAATVWRGLHEPADTNSFALLADAFLHGRFDFTGCFDKECVVSGGKTYLVQPPFPAIVAAPFIAAFGTGFHYFVALALVIAALTLLLWQRIFDRLGVEAETRPWLLLAIAASSPLIYAVLRSDGVWLFAHVVGFALATLAVHEALAGRALTTGLVIGLAFLSRQMSLFLLPFLLALTLPVSATVLPPSAETRARAVKMALAFAVPFLLYLAYNWLRFGWPMETGHSILVAQAPTSVDDTLVTRRLAEIGVFSPKYLIYNLFYLLAQGFHAEFDPQLAIRLTGLDPSGSSVLAGSPFLLFLFFARRDRVLWSGLLSVAAIIGLFLVYHSNGFRQYNVQRYMLDYLPVLLVFLATAVRREHLAVFRLLVVWGVALQVVTVVALALTRG